MDTQIEAIGLRTKGKVVVADLKRGELQDEREILRMLDKLGEVVEKRSKVQLLLNLEKLTYVSSAGIGGMVRLMKKTIRNNGALKLCCIAPDVFEVLQVMHLDKLFSIHDTEEHALENF